jgi:hypothetical protein
MFALDFKNWLEVGVVSPPAELTNISLGIPSKLEAGFVKDPSKSFINPFKTNRRFKNYGKSTTNNRISS